MRERERERKNVNTYLMASCKNNVNDVSEISRWNSKGRKCEWQKMKNILHDTQIFVPTILDKEFVTFDEASRHHFLGLRTDT